MTEIIGIARKGTSKTHIMFKANLSFSQLNQYLSLLLRSSLLEITANDGRSVYRATSKGVEFMEKQCEVIDMLNEIQSGRDCVRAPPVIFNAFSGK